MGTAQPIYLITAMFVVILLNSMLLGNTRAVERQQYQNETLTQVSGVAHEVFDFIGTHPLDARTDTLVYPKPPSSAAELTPESEFGPDCDFYTTCLDLDDFDGKTITVDRKGTEYTVSVDVAYVNELDPMQKTASQTFAKLATLTIENGLVRDQASDSTMTMEISRVFTYLRTTM